LQHGIDVGQKEILAVFELLRNLRIERREDAKLCIQRFGFIHVLSVLAGPEKAFAFFADDAAGVHVAGTEYRIFCFGEVFPHHSDHTHLGKVACGQGKVRGRASQDAVSLAVRGLNGIESDGTYHQQ
jgi:hypothetical protein